MLQAYLCNRSKLSIRFYKNKTKSNKKFRSRLVNEQRHLNQKQIDRFLIQETIGNLSKRIDLPLRDVIKKNVNDIALCKEFTTMACSKICSYLKLQE